MIWSWWLNLYSFSCQFLMDLPRQLNGHWTVAMDTNGLCPHGYDFSIQAFDFAFLNNIQRLFNGIIQIVYQRAFLRSWDQASIVLICSVDECFRNCTQSCIFRLID